MNQNNFCVFIISHGRPDKVLTLKMFERFKFTLPYFIVIDDEDKTADRYYKKYGADKVILFNKKKYADMVDEGNNFDNRRTTTHARNACFDIADKLGYTYFLVLDDDYTSFRYRYIDKYITKGNAQDLDRLFLNTLEFYKKTNALSIAFAQGGDFIGGDSCQLLSRYLYASRKCMNSFFCSTERRFNFIGQLNEDVNTYVVNGSIGHLFLTVPAVGLEQAPTQKTSGGMTDAYLQYGTYIKSFTSVMMQPSSVFVSMMGFKASRLHHRIKMINTTPMIIREKYKK